MCINAHFVIKLKSFITHALEFQAHFVTKAPPPSQADCKKPITPSAVRLPLYSIR